MDNIDLEIVQMLEKDGRMSHEDIAKRLYLTRPAIHKRVEKLEKEGVITGYKALIEWSKVESCIRCLIFLKVNGRYVAAIIDQARQLDIDGVIMEECFRLAGEWCILLKVRIKNSNDTTKILDRIWQVEGVLETSTVFIVS